MAGAGTKGGCLKACIRAIQRGGDAGQLRDDAITSEPAARRLKTCTVIVALVGIVAALAAAAGLAPAVIRVAEAARSVRPAMRRGGRVEPA